MDDTASVIEGNEASMGYKPPAPKSVREILTADAEDESLRRYKETLLGAKSDDVIVDASDPRVVILRSISLVSPGRPDIVFDLDSATEEPCFRIKEGICYRLRFSFHVQKEMVTGLRYSHRVSRLGVPVLSEHFMVGCYPPRLEIIDFVTPAEEAPSGIFLRGKYKVHSKFADDYGTVYAKWDWTLEIAKEW